MASAIRKQNKITTLTQPDGSTTSEPAAMGCIAHQYFQSLFTAQNGDIQRVTNLLHPRLTEADNVQLLHPFTMEEFRVALFSMYSDKSPGPDGLNPGFYKRFWDLLGHEIFHAGTQYWLQQGAFPKQLNTTNVVLIPKKDNPTSMQDLCPISLCNVIYKIISKVLANRVKVLLPKCISQEQSAFVEQRSILDNVLIAIEGDFLSLINHKI
uniref:Transposon TX1 uncharacterized n=1 Tax=Cajanus cajan TaxID=3821 RepID=A0A151UFF3_CAJCA